MFLELAAFDPHVIDLMHADIFIEYALLKFDRRCGKGAHSTVYKGFYKKNVVALKMYTPKEITQEVVRRWAREVSISMLVSHPNIVECYGICVVPPRFIVVMEYCKHTLLTYIRKKDLTNVKLLDLMIDITKAVAFLHERSVVHRDIKSTNVMVSKGRAKLIDFSESRHMIQTSMTIVGTPQYVAPEMFRDALDGRSEYTHKVDIFSLGIVFWEIMHKGKEIYPTHWSIALILKALSQGYRPAIDSGINPRITDIIIGMWAENSLDRPCAADILKELEEIRDLEIYGP
jgi:serine/threonine protein kinase